MWYTNAKQTNVWKKLEDGTYVYEPYIGGEEKDKLKSLMDLEIARKEAIHYIEMGTDSFAVSKGVIEIRRKGGEE